jgi:acyl-CoA thioesterase I
MKQSGPGHSFFRPIVHLAARPRAWVRRGFGLLLLSGMISGAAAQQNMAIYTDSLQNSWNNWSWGSTINLTYGSNSQYIHGGSSSIAITMTSGWGALALEHAAFDSTSCRNLTFWVNGGPSGGQALAVMVTLGGTVQGGQYNFTPAANTWQQITIPLSTPGVAGPLSFDQVWIQSQSGSALPVFYVDDMTLLGPGPVSAANTTITANPAALTADGAHTSTLTVQARDANDNNLTSSSGTVTLSATAGSLSGVTDHADGTCTATLTSSTTPGTANITGTIGGIAIGNPAVVFFTLNAGPFVITNIESAPAGYRIAWNPFPGQSYSVLSSSNLAAWVPTPAGVTNKLIDTQTAGTSPKFYRVKENINPNPRISIGKSTFSNRSNSSVVDDGKFQTSGWGGGSPTPAAPVWVAIHLSPGPARVLLEWNAGFNYNYANPITPTATPSTDYGSPLNYALFTSSNSTTGADGTWTPVASVTNNTSRTRAHSFDFIGMSWVKLSVTAIPTFSSANGLSLDEIEVYDTSVAYSRGRMAEDTWFFMGDSITAFWANRATASGTPPAYTNDPASHMPDFAQLINAANTNYFPSLINGGIGGETSANALARLPANLTANPDYYYWALSYGSNDSAGNNNNTTSFKNNMQAMINLLLANGRMPVIPHIPYASDGSHNYVTNFNAVIDTLVASNHILAGPDLYTFFKANPNQLSDGLHPNDAGMRSFNLLWAQAMRHLYP